MTDDEMRELVERQAQLFREHTAEILAVRAEPKRNWLDTWPKRITAMVAALAALAAILLPATRFGFDLAHMVSHHDEQDAYLAAEDRNHDGVPDHAEHVESVEETVEQNTRQIMYTFCSVAQRDVARGVTDSLPDECRADWERR